MQDIFNKNKIKVTVILTNRRGPLCIICITIKSLVFPKHGTANKRVKILIDNTIPCTSIKMYTFTYNPLRLQRVSIFLMPSSGNLHETNINTEKFTDVNSLRMI